MLPPPVVLSSSSMLISCSRDSYALFATNVILPYLAFVYWPQTTNNKPEYAINCVTLAGSACGQLVFGIVADKLGRRRFYGLELAVVVFATLGMAEASTGMNHSMDIMGWIIFWRFCIGVGIGAEYPLTAVITSEQVYFDTCDHPRANLQKDSRTIRVEHECWLRYSLCNR